MQDTEISRLFPRHQITTPEPIKILISNYKAFFHPLKAKVHNFAILTLRQLSKPI